MRRRARGGLTIVEMLVSTAITLILMGFLVNIFGTVSSTIRDNRSMIEASDSLRAAVNRLRHDLRGATWWDRIEGNGGYFEYIEGPIGPVIGALPSDPPYAIKDDDGDGTPERDTTVGDVDDILLFTTRNELEPFVGRTSVAPPNTSITSPVAEVAWFLRGTTLYRRVRLIRPDLINLSGPFPLQNDFDKENDLSVRVEQRGGTNFLVPNSLADLTRRENRFAHINAASLSNNPPAIPDPSFFPFESRPGSSGVSPLGLRSLRLGLPILEETSSLGWQYPLPATFQVTNPNQPRDFWLNPYPYQNNSGNAELDQDTGAVLDITGNRPGGNPDLLRRIAQDVILTNVIGFDVKAWDPGAPILQVGGTGSGSAALLPGDPAYITALANPTVVGYGAYADLNYMCRLGQGAQTPLSQLIGPLPAYPLQSQSQSDPFPSFHHAGDVRSKLRGMDPSPGLRRIVRAAVYDTWSFHYERDGIDQDGVDGTDQGTNGFDDDQNGGVDDFGEREAPPPYSAPLRGIQVKIRIFEPDSRQVREITLVQDFLSR